jgi:hypothetical protein
MNNRHDGVQHSQQTRLASSNAKERKRARPTVPSTHLQANVERQNALFVKKFEKTKTEANNSKPSNRFEISLRIFSVT